MSFVREACVALFPMWLLNFQIVRIAYLFFFFFFGGGGGGTQTFLLEIQRTIFAITSSSSNFETKLVKDYDHLRRTLT